MSIISKLKNNKKLVSNFSYMFIIEISNYILPIISIPYIVRVVGIEKFGIISFSYIVVSYFSILVDYGFKLISTRDISIYRDSNKKLSVYFWKMYISQLLLLCLGIVIFTIVLELPQLKEHKEIFIFAFGMTLGHFLYPTWFFQGIENMKFIAIMNFISRVTYLIMIFLFIKTDDDYIYVPLYNGLSFIMIGIISLIYIYQKFDLEFKITKFRYIKNFFKKGWHLFTSNIANSLSTNLNILLLGSISGYTAVGVYSIADKLFGAVMNIVGIANIVIYPYLAKLSNNTKILLDKIRYLIALYILFGLLLSSIFFFFSSDIIWIIFKQNNMDSIIVLKILAIVMFIRPFSQLLIHYLVIKKNTKKIQIITLKTMIINFILIFPFLYYYNAIGLAIVIVCVQIFQIITLLKENQELILKRNRKKS